MKYFYLAFIAFCFVACTDKCDDGAIQYDIEKIKKSITSDDDEINFVDLYCRSNFLTYVYQINPDDNFAKTLNNNSAKQEFSEFTKQELEKLYCDKNLMDFYIYKENNIGVKWQYFFEGEKKPFCEVSIRKKDCK